MNKQIEEMAKALGDTWVVDLEGNPHDLSEVLMQCDLETIAEQMYEQNYRKSTDVAREIFAEIMQAIEVGVAKADATVNASAKYPDFREVLKHTGEMYSGYIGKFICEVFKKYESEGAE